MSSTFWRIPLPSQSWIGKSNILHTLYLMTVPSPLPEDFWSPACPHRHCLQDDHLCEVRIASKGCKFAPFDTQRFTPFFHGSSTFLSRIWTFHIMLRVRMRPTCYGNGALRGLYDCIRTIHRPVDYFLFLFARFCYKTGHFYVIPDLGIGRRKEDLMTEQ